MSTIFQVDTTQEKFEVGSLRLKLFLLILIPVGNFSTVYIFFEVKSLKH
jgi:hypothetical protein